MTLSRTNPLVVCWHFRRSKHFRLIGILHFFWSLRWRSRSEICFCIVHKQWIEKWFHQCRHSRGLTYRLGAYGGLSSIKCDIWNSIWKVPEASLRCVCRDSDKSFNYFMRCVLEASHLWRQPFQPTSWFFIKLGLNLSSLFWWLSELWLKLIWCCNLKCFDRTQTLAVGWTSDSLTSAHRI